MEIFEVQFIIAMLAGVVSTVQSTFPTFFLDEWCTTTLDMSVQGIEGGRMLLRPPERGMRYLKCFVHLKAPQGKRLSFRFRAFDIQSPFDCNADHLQLFDDRIMRTELTGRMCNSGQTPEGVYTTTAQEATIRLYKKNYVGDQIELIFSSFHLAPCRGGEFQCSNSHCIAQDLYCNGYDNCGDESDLCFLSAAGIAGVVVAAFVVILLIAIIVAVVLYRRQQHRRLEKLREAGGIVVHDSKGRPVVLQEEHLHYVDAWDSNNEKSGFSDSRSTFSSRLSKSNHHHHHNNNHSHSHHHHHPHHGHSNVTADNSAYEASILPTKRPGHHGGVLYYYEEPSTLKSNSTTATTTTTTTTIATPQAGSSFKSDKKANGGGGGGGGGAGDGDEGRGGSKGGESRIHFGPLTSSTLKKSRSEDSLRDIYSVPRKQSQRDQQKKSKKGKSKWGLKRKSSSVKYLNDKDLYHRDFSTMDGRGEMFERNASFREGMKAQEEGAGAGHSRIPIHTLDVSALAASSSSHHPHHDDDDVHGPDVYDHVMSFRSYPSPEQSRKEKVVYLYPGHPGYHRLQHHNHHGHEGDGTLQSDRTSIHSARSTSSLVKL